MAKSNRDRAEGYFAKTQKAPNAELKQQEKARAAREEKNARLRALRMARDKGEASPGGESEPDAAPDTPSPTMPKAHRHA